MSKKIRIRIQGLAFLVVLALLLGLAVATYQKAFTPVARVTLETDTAGNQLQDDEERQPLHADADLRAHRPITRRSARSSSSPRWPGTGRGR